MEARVKKYLEKRESITRLIESKSSTYETDDCYHKVGLDFWTAKKLAEEILSKFGINKPKFVSERETEGYGISSKYTKET